MASASSPGALQLAAALLGAAFGVTNAHATTLWEYLYGDGDAHRIRQISVAISTAASGIAIWLFALTWKRNTSYHPALVGGGLLATALAVIDVINLARPETLESVVRRGAPTATPLTPPHTATKHRGARWILTLSRLARTA